MTTDIRALIADDGYAASFQSMGQYRTALLAVLRAQADAAPVAWLQEAKKCHARAGQMEISEPNEKSTNPEYWTDAFPVFRPPLPPGSAGVERCGAPRRCGS